MKKILKKYRRVILLVLILIIIITSVVLIVVKHSKTNEKELTTKLVDLGIDFYESYYYDSIENNEEALENLKNFEDKGISVSLENLVKSKIGSDKDEILAEFKNSKTNADCDRDNSKVIIYPKSPYGKKDYKIEAKLECGFDEK